MDKFSWEYIHEKYGHDFVRTYLIQRLRKPYGYGSIGGKDIGKVLEGREKPFVFGGGGSGLSSEAWKLLDPCFSFDYMGAAEFEFGALPKSLTKMINRQPIISYEFTLKPKEIGDNWRRKYPRKSDPPPPQKEPRTVFVICPESYRAFTEEVIHRLAKYGGTYEKGGIDTKEGTRFTDALDPLDTYDRETVGWYELDNGFFFFVDQQVYEKTRELFVESKAETK